MIRHGKRTTEVAFAIDLESRSVTGMPEVALSEIGIRERRDLQRWIEDHPEIVGRDLLVVTTEFDQWEIRETRVADRLDVLFLDSAGSLLVAELKRGEASETADLQALKYAAYCSGLVLTDVVEMYARYHRCSPEAAEAAVYDHAPSVEEDGLRKVRIRLVAGGFGPNVTTVVMWLNDLGLEIGCIEFKARRLPDGRTAILTARQLLPPPSAEEYLVRRRRRREDEEAREDRTRRRDSVAILLENEAVEAGTPLSLKMDEFSGPNQAAVQSLLEREPEAGHAVWTGDTSRAALRWGRDGETYSPTALVKKVLKEVGIHRRAVAGPRYWLLPDGESLADLAVELEPGRPNGAGPLVSDDATANDQ
jgi:RecB family endonuclease NucS